MQMPDLSPRTRATEETAFLISESLAALERFTADPSLSSLENVVSTCDQTSALCKRLEALMPKDTSSKSGPRQRANRIPLETVVLVGEVAVGQRYQCHICSGWKSKDNNSCRSSPLREKCEASAPLDTE